MAILAVMFRFQQFALQLAFYVPFQQPLIHSNSPFHENRFEIYDKKTKEKDHVKTVRYGLRVQAL